MEGEMTVQEIVEQVAEIRRKFHGDDEAHHAREDSLHQSVLEAIAKGVAEDPQRCAEEALKTAEIDFQRWCA